jgi:hypothetical protein
MVIVVEAPRIIHCPLLETAVTMPCSPAMLELYGALQTKTRGSINLSLEQRRDVFA